MCSRRPMMLKRSKVQKFCGNGSVGLRKMWPHKNPRLVPWSPGSWDKGSMQKKMWQALEWLQT